MNERVENEDEEMNCDQQKGMKSRAGKVNQAEEKMRIKLVLKETWSWTS